MVHGFFTIAKTDDSIKSSAWAQLFHGISHVLAYSAWLSNTLPWAWIHTCKYLSCRSNSWQGDREFVYNTPKRRSKSGLKKVLIQPSYTPEVWCGYLHVFIYSKVNHFYKWISMCILVLKSLLKLQLSRETVFRSSATVAQYQSIAMQVSIYMQSWQYIITICGFWIFCAT